MATDFASSVANGDCARQVLGKLVFPRYVRVEVVEVDQYGRKVGRVFEGSTDVNAEMLQRGAA